jgi:hypothetical protein
MRLTFTGARAKTLATPLVVAALAVPAACNDMLTERPRSQIVTETYFTSAADARAAIAAAYRPLADGNVWDTNLQWITQAASDESRVGPEEENANIVSLTQLRWTATNPYTTGLWSGLYQMITRANLVLEKVPAIQMDEAAKNQILGEARFLRALGYHYLVRRPRRGGPRRPPPRRCSPSTTCGGRTGPTRPRTRRRSSRRGRTRSSRTTSAPSSPARRPAARRSSPRSRRARTARR